MRRDSDDELTTERTVLSSAWHFRCSHCELEAVLGEAVSRAPVCACGRYMAPVNCKRGQA